MGKITGKGFRITGVIREMVFVMFKAVREMSAVRRFVCAAVLLTISALICLIAFFAIVLLTDNGTWVSAAFGGVAGVLIGIAVIVAHRFLSPDPQQE